MSTLLGNPDAPVGGRLMAFSGPAVLLSPLPSGSALARTGANAEGLRRVFRLGRVTLPQPKLTGAHKLAVCNLRFI